MIPLCLFHSTAESPALATLQGLTPSAANPVMHITKVHFRNLWKFFADALSSGPSSGGTALSRASEIAKLFYKPTCRYNRVFVKHFAYVSGSFVGHCVYFRANTSG